MVYLFATIIYILNLIDYAQTIYAVNHIGIEVELNPIGVFLLENNIAWIMKIIITPIILTLMILIIKKDKAQIWVFYVLLIFYALVVINNFIMLSQINILLYGGLNYGNNYDSLCHSNRCFCCGMWRYVVYT